MVLQVLHCSSCQGTDIVRHGMTRQGKQRYRCRQCLAGRGRTFLLEYSYAGKKVEPRWLWHAIDHHSGTVLAYVFGRRKDAVFLQLQALLAPFGIPRFYTDGWGAYERHIAPEQYHVGKENTQKIESKHLNGCIGKKGAT